MDGHRGEPEVMKADLGLVHVYFGKGVGKSTRAIGLAIRAAGAGLAVDFVQFMKSGDSSEVGVFEKIAEIRYRCPGKHPFILADGPKPMHYAHAEKAMEYAETAFQGNGSILICDEILNAISFGLIPTKRVLDLIALARDRMELVLTGREIEPELLKAADYATEFVQIKHPFEQGVKARRAIEY